MLSAQKTVIALLLSLSGTCHGIPDFPIPEPSRESGYTSKMPLDFSPFEEALANLSPNRLGQLNDLLLPESVTITNIQRLLDTGELTSEELITFYISRIKTYDEGVLNAVAQLNPNALDDARASDDARKAGTLPTGQMAGIPVLFKWNIAISGLSTNAGAVAMKDWIPSRDSFLVEQMRSAGAIVLGHTQLSEWANYLDPGMPNGFSALGGQARAAYGQYDPYGSSTGSAVAATANFAPVTVGSETSGSIIMPAKVDNVVGLRPSTGLVSDDYIIPLCSSLDTAGPMAKSVTDLSIALTAMTGIDSKNPSAADTLKGVNFTQYVTTGVAGELSVGIPFFAKDAALDPRLRLSAEELDAATVQIYREYFEEKNQRYMETAQIFEEGGIQVTTFDPMSLWLSRFELGPFLEYCMADSFDSFASQLSLSEPTFPRRTLANVVAFNKQDPQNFIPYGQQYIEASVDTEITATEFEQIKNTTIGNARAVLDSAFSESGADIILVNDLSQAYSIAGYPALTLPGGYEPLLDSEGEMPVGTIFNAPHLGEAKLIRVAYFYEQATKFRVNPDLEVTSE